MNLRISQVDCSDEQQCKEIVNYLVPHERQSLFLLGNLLSSVIPFDLYVVRQDEHIVGVLGYDLLFQSCSVFSATKEASRALGEHVVQLYEIRGLTGMKVMAHPVLDVFLRYGLQSLKDAEKVFLECDLRSFQPFALSAGKIRRVEARDVDKVVLLKRYLSAISLDQPISAEEQSKALAGESYCLEIDGKMVSVASTNGLVVKIFQILGVATDPLFRGRGFAKAVCSYLMQRMKERGAERAIIFTDRENDVALRCYKALGFQQTDSYYCVSFKES
ncbi:MAG: GNAT family N-acetyltransferase [Parachlamydiales bacterium]|nr:GNAT family N-acetyltransferase [Parachlamydiales bacterium]